MTLYEALSLLVSAIGTLGTVYIGLRQLRRPAPTPPVPAGPPLPASQPYVAGHPYSAGSPYSTGSPYPAVPPQPQVAGSWAAGQPAAPTRPGLVTAASLLLYTAATAQPVVFAIYYGI